jgi:hypothetical protein
MITLGLLAILIVLHLMTKDEVEAKKTIYSDKAILKDLHKHL